MSGAFLSTTKKETSSLTLLGTTLGITETDSQTQPTPVQVEPTSQITAMAKNILYLNVFFCY